MKKEGSWEYRDGALLFYFSREYGDGALLFYFSSDFSQKAWEKGVGALECYIGEW